MFPTSACDGLTCCKLHHRVGSVCSNSEHLTNKIETRKVLSTRSVSSSCGKVKPFDTETATTQRENSLRGIIQDHQSPPRPEKAKVSFNKDTKEGSHPSPGLPLATRTRVNFDSTVHNKTAGTGYRALPGEVDLAPLLYRRPNLLARSNQTAELSPVSLDVAAHVDGEGSAACVRSGDGMTKGDSDTWRLGFSWSVVRATVSGCASNLRHRHHAGFFTYLPVAATGFRSPKSRRVAINLQLPHCSPQRCMHHGRYPQVRVGRLVGGTAAGYEKNKQPQGTPQICTPLSHLGVFSNLIDLHLSCLLVRRAQVCTCL